jgi:hypothetical protein
LSILSWEVELVETHDLEIKVERTEIDLAEALEWIEMDWRRKRLSSAY